MAIYALTCISKWKQKTKIWKNKVHGPNKLKRKKNIRERKNSQSKNTASNIASFIETLFRVLIFLLTFEKFQILRMAPYSNVLRWCHQNRRCWDRISRSIHSARHVRFTTSPEKMNINLIGYVMFLFGRRENARKMLGNRGKGGNWNFGRIGFWNWNWNWKM